MNDVQIIRAEDARGIAFEADGYVLVGESWGARLRLSEPPDLMKIRQAVMRAEQSGITVQELPVEYADALYDLELANNADYPYTPATFQVPPERDAIRGLWQSGKRIFGALDGGVLVAAAVGQIVDGVGDNDFASVLESHRGRGLGAAVAALSILTFAAEGVRMFSAGELQSMPPVSASCSRWGFTSKNDGGAIREAERAASKCAVSFHATPAPIGFLSQ
ncbi:hypothetical protein [Frigoribacterium sp. CG_9.8]|uniref:hypothetical protein n=1 Tax=Frigoribacterium sp. CG_9.8 TaxID=2787733 RepID=UPI0018CB0822|nr:hypothetical protein [Frigoribacterium sp. CG_9.8]MBG6108952.1 hypothetical protein [Frigoribacterium sp. CG_9.8]